MLSCWRRSFLFIHLWICMWSAILNGGFWWFKLEFRLEEKNVKESPPSGWWSENGEHGNTLSSSHFCPFYWLLVCQNRPSCCGIWARSTKRAQFYTTMSVWYLTPALVWSLFSVRTLCVPLIQYVSVFFAGVGSVFSLVSFLVLLQLAPLWSVLCKSLCFWGQWILVVVFSSFLSL